MNRRYSHIDLFAGAGGICTGFEAAGLKTAVAVEYVDSCCETYSANHPTVSVINKDIRKVTRGELRKQLKLQDVDQVDVVSAGFPCETFSTAGSNSRVYSDHRNFLYKEAIRIASELNTKLLLLENVPAFLSKRISKTSKKKVFDCLIEDLEEAGFKHYKHFVLNAADYGVPQSRKRFIMLASKKLDVTKCDLDVGKLSGVTVGQALSDLPSIGPEETSCKYRTKPKNSFQEAMRLPAFWGIRGKQSKKIISELSYQIAPKHRRGMIRRFALIRPGESLKSLFDRLNKKKIEQLQKERVLPNKWFIQRNYRIPADGISRTLTSHCLDELVHPTLNRGLTVREAARLQSFPDWYDFRGGPILCPHMYKTQDKYEQIGDAVPPLLAHHIGNQIIRFLNTESHAARSSSRQREVQKAL